MVALAAPEIRPHAETPPPVVARAAGLRYVSDATPGIRRKAAGSSYTYVEPDGGIVRDHETRARIKSLAIPPAWTDVWICPRENGHIQATGRDGKGRKQYRYHATWRATRDATKYERMIAFASSLPSIREQVDADLSRPGLPREKVLATVLRLLETTLIRVGNEEYARANKSIGLTTMRDQHVDVNGSTLKFRFRGKSGKTHDVGLRDRRLARIVKQCRDLPGYDLFQYLAEDGAQQSIGSADVNDYLREVSGQEFTAKDFRTWAGTVLAALALQGFEEFDSEAQAKRNVTEAIESVARRLGNTPAICRKCYVHPAVIESYLDGTMIETLRRRTEEELSESVHDLPPEEAAVLAMLRERLSK